MQRARSGRLRVRNQATATALAMESTKFFARKAIARRPSEAALSESAAEEHQEAYCRVGTNDDFGGLLAEFGMVAVPVFAGIALSANSWRSHGK